MVFKSFMRAVGVGGPTINAVLEALDGELRK